MINQPNLNLKFYDFVEIEFNAIWVHSCRVRDFECGDEFTHLVEVELKPIL